MPYSPELKFIPYEYLKVFSRMVRPFRGKFFSKQSLVLLLSRALSGEQSRFLISGYNNGNSSEQLAIDFMLAFGANSRLISTQIRNYIDSRRLLSGLLKSYFIVKQEFWFMHSRADLAVFDGTSIGIEIKTERDNFNRLNRQLQDYKDFFEYVYIVVHEDALDSLLEHLREIDYTPGIIAYERKDNSIIIKEKRHSPGNEVDDYSRLEALSRDETINLIRKYDPSRKGLSKLNKADLTKELYRIDPIKIRKEVNYTLMKRFKVAESHVYS